MKSHHPKLNSKGQPVLLTKPTMPTLVSAWLDSAAVATVVPEGDVPEALNGIIFEHWKDVPSTDAQWEVAPGQCIFQEPEFNVPAGKRPAAGVLIEEADGRVWLVAPSNAFGGYVATFPKGGADHGANLQACAIREAFEESGLKVSITGWLADSDRSRSYTRYYRAIRTGGTPAAMGWESQAVHLVPRAALHTFLTHQNDVPLLDAIGR